MIEIGKKFFWGYRNAQQALRTQQQKYHSLERQAQEQARALEQQLQADTAYLFRTAAEKMRQSSQVALNSLSERQARRAANGVSTTNSASASEDAQQTKLGTQSQNSAVSADLQTQGAQKANTFAQKWQALWHSVYKQRKSAKNTGRFGTLSRALLSLFQ